MSRVSTICPLTGSLLFEADASLLTELNRQITAGVLSFGEGHLLSEPLEGALVTQGGEIAYPVKLGIPQLLPKLAISLEGPGLGKSVE